MLLDSISCFVVFWSHGHKHTCLCAAAHMLTKACSVVLMKEQEEEVRKSQGVKEAVDEEERYF